MHKVDSFPNCQNSDKYQRWAKQLSCSDWALSTNTNLKPLRWVHQLTGLSKDVSVIYTLSAQQQRHMFLSLSADLDCSILISAQDNVTRRTEFQFHWSFSKILLTTSKAWRERETPSATFWRHVNAEHCTTLIMTI